MDETREATGTVGGRGAGPTIGEATAHMRDDVAQLREAAERRGDEVIEQIRSLVVEHPLAAVGAAFGIGYLLSGALVSRTTLRFGLLGARWYAGRMMRDLVAPAPVSERA